MLALFFFATILVASQGSDLGPTHQIHLLRPQSGSRGDPVPGVSCLSWRLGVETRNIIGWTTVPQECEGYVGHYMLGHQYRKDSKVIVKEALVYAQSLTVTGSDKDVWVFDIDETTLSNLPYYAQHEFGYVVKQKYFVIFFFYSMVTNKLSNNLNFFSKTNGHTHLLMVNFRIIYRNTIK